VLMHGIRHLVAFSEPPIRKARWIPSAADPTTLSQRRCSIAPLMRHHSILDIPFSLSGCGKRVPGRAWNCRKRVAGAQPTATALERADLVGSLVSGVEMVRRYLRILLKTLRGLMPSSRAARDLFPLEPPRAAATIFCSQ